MAILVLQELPEGATWEQVNAVSAIVAASGPPKGCLSHCLYEDGGHIRSADIWESEEDMQAFVSGRLTDAIVQVATAAGMDPAQLPRAPEPSIFPAFDNFPLSQG